MRQACPKVSVVVPTRERPELLAGAVRAILGQRYAGEIECLVVFDQAQPHPIDVEQPCGDRSLRVLCNDRTPGLAGARNTGILAASGEVIGHCDDDDEWAPDKLGEQLRYWQETPDAVAVATGIVVRTEQGEHIRYAPVRAGFADFLRSRIMEINSSNILVRRADLTGRIGLLDEQVPYAFGEDYEWLLRASKHGDIISVQQPLVTINWARPSFYMTKYRAMAAGLDYILARFPEFATERTGRARIEGQIAFAHAAQRHRRRAAAWALRTLRDDLRQLRGYAALAVAAGLASPQRLVLAVQARGKGL